jgi:signal transducing adaptor molecule
LPFDPNGVYADPNVQAWAKYYAQGGKDKAGAVYFISVPGVTDDATQTVEQQAKLASQSPQQPAPPSQPPSVGVGDSSRSQGSSEAYEPYVSGQAAVPGAVTQTRPQPLDEHHDVSAASVPHSGLTASMQPQQNSLPTAFTGDHLAVNGINSPQSVPTQQALLPHPLPAQTQGVSAFMSSSDSQALPQQLAAMNLNDSSVQNIQYSTL